MAMRRRLPLCALQRRRRRRCCAPCVPICQPRHQRRHGDGACVYPAHLRLALTFRIGLDLSLELAAAEGGSLETALLPALHRWTWCREASVFLEKSTNTNAAVNGRAPTYI
jgi:hypothetical protein